MNKKVTSCFRPGSHSFSYMGIQFLNEKILSGIPSFIFRQSHFKMKSDKSKEKSSTTLHCSKPHFSQNRRTGNVFQPNKHLRFEAHPWDVKKRLRHWAKLIQPDIKNKQNKKSNSISGRKWTAQVANFLRNSLLRQFHSSVHNSTAPNKQSSGDGVSQETVSHFTPVPCSHDNSSKWQPKQVEHDNQSKLNKT